jgi:triphosphoribosyl-dephospho-CoA synthetase
MLLAACLKDLRQKLKDNWGNPKINKDQQHELEKMLGWQELFGAMLSTFDNAGTLKKVYKEARELLERGSVLESENGVICN